MDEKKLHPQEEVDLGNLFKVVGKGINNLFNAIIQFFKSIFHYFILFLIFLRRHALKLSLAILLGFILGFVLDFKKQKNYVSNLIVEVNYDSGAQLYKKVAYLSNLIKRKDTATLAKVLNISISEASQLNNISVTPFQPERNLYKSYDEYIQTIDTIYTKGLTIKDYEKRLDKYDYKYQDIEVDSYSKNIFPNIRPALVAMVENEYFINKRNRKVNEIKQKLFLLHKNLNQIDSLRNKYKKVALKEAEKISNTSTIEISKRDIVKNENDIKLFKTSDDILKEISWTNKDLIDKQNILNIISDFDNIGVVDKKILHKKSFQLAALFFSLMLFWILLIQLNKYLKNYKK